MKRTIILSALVMFMAGACKSKKHSTASSDPSEAQLTALKAKEPNATMADLQKGHSIFYGACTNCHGAKNVSGYSESELKNVINQMSAKAKLSDSDKDAVWKYALAVNLSSKK
jgi:cytochrome c2